MRVLAQAAVVLVTSASLAVADEFPIPTVEIESAAFDVQELYAGTIDVDWRNFPVPGSHYFSADYQFGFFITDRPIYLQRVTRSTDPPMFYTDENKFLAEEPWYNSSQLWQVEAQVDVGINNARLYVECPSGSRFVGGNVSSGGMLQLFDDFGGVMDAVSVRITYTQGNSIRRVIVIQFARPGKYYVPDINCFYCQCLHGCDLLLGGTVQGQATIQGTAMAVPIDVRGVQIVSVDSGAASPGFIDAGDVAGFASRIGQYTSWEPNTLNCNYDYVMNSPGPQKIDAGDLWQGGYNCVIPKATNEADDASLILAWFGIGPTGRDVIVPGLGLVPELDVLNRTAM